MQWWISRSEALPGAASSSSPCDTDKRRRTAFDGTPPGAGRRQTVLAVLVQQIGAGGRPLENFSIRARLLYAPGGGLAAASTTPPPRLVGRGTQQAMECGDAGIGEPSVRFHAIKLTRALVFEPKMDSTLARPHLSHTARKPDAPGAECVQSQHDIHPAVLASCFWANRSAIPPGTVLQVIEKAHPHPIGGVGGMPRRVPPCSTPALATVVATCKQAAFLFVDHHHAEGGGNHLTLTVGPVVRICLAAAAEGA